MLLVSLYARHKAHASASVVYADIGKVEYIAHRLIKTKASDPLPFRLGALISGVVELILEQVQLIF